MTKRTQSDKNRPLHPVDLDEVTDRLRLGIGQTAELCGISIRQLSYWTDKGMVKTVGSKGSRAYDYPAIEKLMMIKQALDQGYSLEGAVSEAETVIGRRNEHKQRLARMSQEELKKLVLSQADQLGQLADQIRREVKTHQVSGDLGGEVASLGSLEKLITFFEANPYTVNTARKIALGLGRDVKEVEQELELLEQRRFLRKVDMPWGTVYRYIPKRRK